MKCIILFCLATLALTQPIAEDGYVLVLDVQNFDSVIRKFDYVLVDFYATWCSHCVQLAPTYQAVARAMRSPTLQLAKIDCPTNQHICSRYQIQGFPTLMLFENGQMILEYSGERTQQDITNWLRKKASKGSEEAKSIDQLKRFPEQNQFGVIFFGESADSIEFQQYAAYATKNKHIPALHTFNQNFANELRAQVPSMIVYKQYDERKAPLTDDFSYQAISKFVLKHSFPILMTFDVNMAKRIFKGTMPTVFLIQNSQTTYGEKQLRLAMSKIKDQVLICIANTDNRYGMRLMQYFGISPQTLPRLVAFNPTNEDFRVTQDISKDNIISFTSQFVGALPERKVDL